MAPFVFSLLTSLLIFPSANAEEACTFVFAYPSQAFTGLAVRTKLKRQIRVTPEGPTFPPDAAGYVVPPNGRVEVEVPWGDPIGQWEWVVVSGDKTTESLDPLTGERRLVPVDDTFNFPSRVRLIRGIRKDCASFRENYDPEDYSSLPEAWLPPTYGSKVRYWKTEHASRTSQVVELYIFDGESYFKNGATALLESIAKEYSLTIRALFVDPPRDLQQGSLRDQAYGLDQTIHMEHLRSVSARTQNQNQSTGLVETLRRFVALDAGSSGSDSGRPKPVRIAVGMSLGAFFALEFAKTNLEVEGVVAQSGAFFLVPGQNPLENPTDWTQLNTGWGARTWSEKFISLQTSPYDLPITQEANGQLQKFLAERGRNHHLLISPTWHSFDSVIEVLQQQLVLTFKALKAIN